MITNNTRPTPTHRLICWAFATAMSLAAPAWAGEVESEFDELEITLKLINESDDVEAFEMRLEELTESDQPSNDGETFAERDEGFNDFPDTDEMEDRLERFEEEVALREEGGERESDERISDGGDEQPDGISDEIRDEERHFEELAEVEDDADELEELDLKEELDREAFEEEMAEREAEEKMSDGEAIADGEEASDEMVDEEIVDEMGEEEVIEEEVIEEEVVEEPSTGEEGDGPIV